jgi:hypothetical protein
MPNQKSRILSFKGSGKITENRGSWVYLVPIKNLKITQAVKRELRINKVKFYNVDKLPYIKKRLGISERISSIRKNKMIDDFLNDSDSYAIPNLFLIYGNLLTL